jgi:hypothetical protein
VPSALGRNWWHGCPAFGVTRARGFDGLRVALVLHFGSRQKWWDVVYYAHEGLMTCFVKQLPKVWYGYGSDDVGVFLKHQAW